MTKDKISIHKDMLPGLAWHNGKWKYFYDWEELVKGRYKGMVELKSVWKNLRVHKDSIKRYPLEIKEKKNKIIEENQNDITNLTTIIKKGKAKKKKQ